MHSTPPSDATAPDVPSPDLVPGPDGVARPAWALSHPLLTAYYDHEWGRPRHAEQPIFEHLCLECFQAGLSWLTILKRRPALDAAFAGFEPDLVARFDDEDVERLLADPAIIRNRAKVRAVVGNARATVGLRADGGLAPLVWSFAPASHTRPWREADVPSQSPESVALAKELRRRGFRFVGPTTVYALLQAVGVVDDRLVGAAAPA